MVFQPTFAYYRRHIWNALPSQVNEYTDIISLKNLLKTWEGSKFQSNMRDNLN